MHKLVRVQSRRVILVPLMLTALLVALGMAALSGRNHVTYAAPLTASPSDILYVVASGGMTSGDCQRVTVPPANPGDPTTYNYSACTLAYALSIAIDGNTLRLGEGTYAQAVVITKSISLEGSYPITFSTYPNDPMATPDTRATYIAPSTAAPAVTIEGPITSTATRAVGLKGLRFSHLGPQDRAISLIGPISPTIGGLKISLDLTDSEVQGNTATSTGGGIYVDSRIIASIGVTDTEFSGNIATAGGAIYLSPGSKLYGSGATFLSNEATVGNGGAIYASAGTTVTLSTVTMTGNKATAGNGGAIYARDTALTLDGSISNSNATSGLGGGLFLSATVSAPATISTLTLTGNKATNGGALYATNIALTLSASVLNNNEATSGSGGALYLNGGTVTIGALPITNNKAGMHGGGIYRLNGDLTLTNNNIMTNTAIGGSGGGIAMSGSGVASFTNVRFLNNIAGAAGGGAYVGASAVTVSGNASNEIRNNTAQNGNGGGLYITSSGGVTITNSLVRGNQASNPGNGGGIFITAATAFISGNSIMTNTASAGGGLYLSGTVNGGLVGNTIQYNRAINAATGNGGGLYLSNNTNLSLTTLTLSRNSAQVNGGALYATGSSMNASGPVSVTFNTAQGHGGAIAAVGSTLLGTSLTAENNTAATGNGGAFWLQNSKLTWSGANTVRYNKAYMDGGAFYVSGGGISVGGLATIISNTVTMGSGGALYLASSAGFTATGTLNMQENIAKIDGGGILVDVGTLSLPGGGTVNKNVATTGSGGAFNFVNSTNATFGVFTFQSNRAQVNGGAVRARASTLTFTGDTNVISNTAVAGNGGAFHLTIGLSTTFTQKLTLKGNKAALNGGGIFAEDVSLSFGNNSEITDNVAQAASGGGVYLVNGTLTTAKISFLRNTAKVDGGGLYAPSGALTLANASVVQLNKAETGNGGGLYTGGGLVTLTGVLIEQNNAKLKGGGVYLTGNPLVTALLVQNNSIVRLNTSSTAQGGGFFVMGGEVTIDNSTVNNNQAQTGGGGLYQIGGTLNISNSALIEANSTITDSGGGLAVLTGTVNILSLTQVRNNSAYKDGGGLYAPGSAVTINSSTFSGNNINFDLTNVTIDVKSMSAGRGGGIYADGINLVVNNSTFTNNSARMGGGGIYARTLFVQVKESTFTGNNGGRGNGGATYLRADLVNVLQNTLDTNETAGNGGAVAIEDTTASSIISNTLTNNVIRTDVIIKTAVIAEPVVVSGRTIVEPGTYTGQEETEGTGAGIYVERSTGGFVGNFILHNENKSGDGGGLYLSSSTITMTNNVVAQNSIALSTSYASGLYVINTALNMRHNTIADNLNKSPETGASNVGVYVTKSQEANSTVQMTNNIIAGHQTGMLLLTGNTSSLINNLFFNTEEDWGGPVEYVPASGNQVGDPLFVDPNNDNYDIQRKSAAFDMGTSTTVAYDIRGAKRPRAFGSDAGAYEQFYQQGVHMVVTASPIFANNGDQITYQVKVANHSPTAINNVGLNFVLPSQQVVNSISGPGCAGTSCSFGTMNPEALNIVTLVATANGTPPDQGFIEMETNINVTIGGAGPSDTTEKITTRLQRCRIRYSNTDYISFPAAIAAVNTNDDLPDIIRVSGYCGGNLEINKKLTIQGGWNFPMTINDPVAFPTTIDGGGAGRVIRILGDIAPTVEHITLRGGNARGLGGGPSGKDAGGIMYILGARATIANVRMVGGRAAFGAGLYVASLTAPIIRDSIIESGNASERGGGVYAHNSSPELTNVTIKSNTAKAGGGVYLYKSEAKIVNCNITDNTATGSGSYLEVAGFNIRFSVGGGGGVNFDESKASISGGSLERNTAKAGGAIFADNSPGSVIGALIDGNEANGSSSIAAFIVLANKPGGGGAIYAQRSDLVIEHNRITNNRATAAEGGAIHIFNGSADPKINGNFMGFNSASKGAAVYVHLKPDVFQIFVLPLSLPPQLIPLILGLPLPDPPKLVMINNTIAHNSGGTIVHFFGASYGEMIGNIVAFNQGTSVQASTQTMPYIALIPVPIIFFIPIPFPIFHVPKVEMNYTLWYQNGTETSTSGVGASVTRQNDITGKDPAFKNDGYHIKRISSAYNTGKNTGIPVDIDGQTRPQADITDMGADEYPALGVRYVAVGGVDTASGEKCANYLNPCGTLQNAIDAASEGDLIKMAGGTYTSLSTRNGQTQMGYITKTLTIQGGYYRYTNDNTVTEGNYTIHDWEVPFPKTNPTILDAGNGGRVLFIYDEKRLNDEGDEIKVEPLITGVIMKNGNSNGLKGPQGNQFDAGGAIYLDRTTAKIISVDIGNSTADYGGAIYMISSTLTLSNVVVHDNIANDRGGGLYLETSNDVSMKNVIIELNKAPRGGGLYLDRSGPLLQFNAIRSNGDSSTTLEGGGIFLDNSPANIISNTITANNAANGAGVFAIESNANINGNTITNNKALNASTGNGRGGGCFVGPGATNFLNNTFQGNQAILGAGCFLNDSSANFRFNQVLENIATNSGGGFYLRNSSGALVQEGRIDANRANGTAVDTGGGGLFLESSNATIRFITITNNLAVAGAGIYLFSFSNATVEENTISANTATQDGGGLYLKLSDAQLTKNTITFNKTAQGNGGGVYVRLSSAKLNENTIEENVAILAGGGVYLDQSGASLELDKIRNNVAKDGAGVYILRSDTAKFDKVAIALNRASQFGGGVYIRLSSVPLEDHAILDNFAQVAGGGVYIDESAVNFNRNIVRNNEAGQQGGGIAITRRSLAILGSNAVVDNKAGNTGSGIWVAGSQPKLIHTTLARNVGGDGTGISAITADGSPSIVTMVNTILANQNLAVRASTGNTVTLQATLWDSNGQKFATNEGKILTGNPDLNFDGQVRFQADGIHLQNNSKAIGVGVESEVGRDIDGDGRPQGNGPELGADELLADCAAVVNTNLSVVYTKVQDAINAANPGDEVRISGTCVGARLQAGTTQLAYINKAITVRGGYTPTNWLLSFPITQPTFLDAQGEGRVIFIASGTNATVERLNLSGGDAKNLGGGPGGLDAGGILYVRNANPILVDLSLAGGDAYYGGGLYLEGSNITLTNAKFTSNSGVKGGALFLRNAPATLRNNLFEDNVATDGAGIFLSFSQATLESNTIVLNSATAAGGGLFLESSNATLRRNGILTNTAQTAGGLYIDGGGPILQGNTINANVGQNGGGIYLATSTASVVGNKFIGNSGGIGAGIYVQAGNPLLDNNVIAKNVGQIQAAAIYILSSSPKLRQNTLAANTGGDGSGIFITDLGVQPATIEMVNNIFVDHTVAITLTAGNKVTLRNNLWNNNAKDWGGSGIVDDKGNHVRAAPLFVDSDNNDYHLQAASPARDRGASDAGVATDFDNQSRPADNGFDIGADEFVFTGIQVFIQTVPDPVVAGAPFQLIVRVVNIGNIDQNAKITVTLPTQMTPSGILTFDATILRGETWIQTINATVNATFSGSLKIKADVTTSADTRESIEASISVEKPDFAIALIAEASPSPVPAGAELTYQIRVNNVGNRPINAALEVILPAPVSVAAPLNFTPGQLGPAGAWTKSVRTTVAADAKGYLVAVFHATTLEGPKATYTLTVPIAAPSLRTSVSAVPDPVLAGRTVTYTLRVTNTGNIDFTNTITFVAPVDANGRPLIAPGADQVFTNVAIPAGQTWTQTIVAVVLPGYVGPLNSQVRVDTLTGPVTVYNDTRQVVLPVRGPTIIAVNSGPWNDPNTWEPKRIPNASDIALVLADVTVTVDGSRNNPIVMTGLINEGTILLNCIVGEDMELSITEFIENTGLIRGSDAQKVGEPGCGIAIATNELINTGIIRAGDGADGAVVPPNNDIINGGDGGAMSVFAQNVVNEGTIRAGDGGDLLFPATSGKGGDGGDILVVAGPPVPALILNAGLIAAGDGGAGPGRPQGDGRGGDGGSASVLSATQFINDGGEVRAGKGGDGNGDGIAGGEDDGNDGGVSISAAFIWDNGVMTSNGRDFAFNTLAKPLVRGVIGATVLLPISFLNEGLRTDTYDLLWANTKGWEQAFLPKTTRVAGLRYGLLFAPFSIPTNAIRGEESEVRLTALSQGSRDLTQVEIIRVLVIRAGNVWLPSVHNKGNSSVVTGQAQSQSDGETYYLPIIGD